MDTTAIRRPGRPALKIADPESFGGRVRAIRTQQGRTLVELAAMASLSYSALREIELGETDPPLSTCRRVAAALGLRLGRLVD